MDVIKTLQELHLEKKRLDAAIATLEGRLRAAKGPKATTKLERRGRKSMNEEERKAVSARMAKYWAEKRGQAENSNAEPVSEETNPPSESN